MSCTWKRTILSKREIAIPRVDRLRRKCGFYAQVAELDPSIRANADRYPDPNGLAFEAYFTPTRNGQGYQAGTSKCFATVAEAEAYLDTALADAQKRALRNKKLAEA